VLEEWGLVVGFSAVGRSALSRTSIAMRAFSFVDGGGAAAWAYVVPMRILEFLGEGS
jgi:hypothetical protein